jgi:hypothetical protein
MGSPFLGSEQPYDRTHPAPRIDLSYIPVALFAVYLLFLPPPLSIAADTDTDAVEYDHAPDEQPSDDQTPSAELPGKQNPLEHSDITYSFFLLLALEIATALLYPILMHSLIL